MQQPAMRQINLNLVRGQESVCNKYILYNNMYFVTKDFKKAKT